ncbi:MAG: polysaccharide deacetylase family protein [Rhizobiales bacterium]|nr:polysaccharide deacetylase family protein [Hyphomicrobiales bacterium]
MGRLNKKIVRTGLETIYHTGGHLLGAPFLSGVGSILTFHHVRPARPDAFQPNRSLEIEPAFLEEVLKALRAADVDIVTLDELHRRLTGRDFRRRFVALTFDDGYRDNRDHALPILRKYEAPFTLFAPSAFAEGTGDLWWIALERAIARADSIALPVEGTLRTYDCSTDDAKDETFTTVYWWLRSLPSEAEMRQVIRELALEHRIDVDSICREFCMDWSELAAFARDPLVAIGAHTDSHVMLAKASPEAARADILRGVGELETKLGVRPAHLSFPVGDPTSAGPRDFDIARELGFRTAVTTRPGVLFAEHSAHLTALPRISVNGEFQRVRYLNVLLSGVPTALMNRFRRVNAA